MRTMNVDECADFLNIEKSHALKLSASGELPGAKIGRAWVFLESDLVNYLQSKVREQMAQRRRANEIGELLSKSSVNTEVITPVLPAKGRVSKRAAPPLS